jgi:hypothetical protein
MIRSVWLPLSKTLHSWLCSKSAWSRRRTGFMDTYTRIDPDYLLLHETLMYFDLVLRNIHVARFIAIGSSS